MEKFLHSFFQRKIMPSEAGEEDDDKNKEWSNEKAESSCLNKISMVWYKAFYMFFIGAFWMKIVYLPLYFKQIGLPAHYAGVLAGISPFLRGAGSFFLGLLAEKPETRKVVLLMSLVAQIVTPLLCLIPHPADPIPQGPYMKNGTWVVNITSIAPMGDPPAEDFLDTLQNCFKGNCLGYQLMTDDSPEIPRLNQSDHARNSTLSKPSLLNIKLDVISTFWIILAIITVGEFLGGPARSLADAATLQALGEDKKNFGYVRLWGNVGQLMLTIIIYALLRYEHVTLNGIEQGNYLFAVIVIVFWMALAFPTALGFACDHKKDMSADMESNGKEDSNGINNLSDVLMNFSSLSLLAITFCIGMLNGTFNTFMFWFVIDIAGSRGNLIITVALALRITYIILAFRVSGPIIGFLGVMNVTHVSLLLYSGIFVMYGLVKNPWLAIIPEVFQNIIKALTEVAVILFFGEITPFRWAATVQGIVQSLLEGFGFGVGPIIGGFLVMSLGIRYTFMLFGAFATGICIFSLCTHGINWAVMRATEDQEKRFSAPMPISMK
ncbi:major facilitator superfamily domain-containing protein 6-like [Actinia tenebrosa]|uniref:Major facilitator superfamily domain-containing protein 6-like n=1 Tax=Actinia tenebrosa TaxID=6105 RepID=A0A6P8HHT2_ACTTE|nr:major facilitator superfamily domain-containing protein 6-like [Actinia tenebrosa]